ncbi:uncharacterized protein LOC123399006 [Hordeum vulgare subsp. vulgare]|uniref:uncharacterized protein LOC123399006 n=1 Tax=Hordeum vulgare subsp. vulgare TaxID=112509 RepID=UPI001D1A46F5|nr:uncharacterized protein LOC123399006 [Hordeum vulgare subsp. vulgare]
MGFRPYFLHEYSSDGMSAIFTLTAGTLTVVFTRFLLLLEQWHRLPVVLASECAPAQGFLLCPHSGGLPADTRLRPLDTLPSAAVTDEKKDVDVIDVAPDMVRFGLVKSSVRLCGCGTGAAIETGATTVKGAGLDGSMARGRGGEGGGATRVGPRRKRAWPVRARMEITLRNLETA